KVNMIPDAARTAPPGVARPAAPVAAKPPAPARPPVAITAAAPKRAPPSEDRTVVGQLPKDDDADFTSIIDKLGE
ncbi:MAG: hypothetical protein IAE78_21260, partial [Myxococcus sp.]|nr:hypothetical protein [Myxococcus sp.]